MEKEITRVNRIAITMVKTREGESKFALRFYPKPYDKEGVLGIQHLLTEDLVREMASAFQKTVEYIDRS